MLKDEKYGVKALNGQEELVRVGTKAVPTLRKCGRFSPVCRAEYRSFRRDQPEGAMQGCIGLTKGQEAPFGNPRRKRQICQEQI